MNNGAPDALRELVRKRAQALGGKAVESGGCLPPEDLEELDRLRRLADLIHDSKPRPRRPLWPVAALFAVTAAAVGFLAFGRMARTEISLDAETARLSFMLPVEQVFAEPVSLPEVGISGDARLDLPLPDGGFERLERFPVRLAATDSSRGSLSLSPLTLPGGARVTLEYSGSPGRFRISHRGKRVTHRISLAGEIGVTGAGPGPETFRFRAPRPARVDCGEDDVHFDLTLPEGTILVSALNAAGLDFVTVDEVATATGAALRRRSAIRSGTLYFESLNGRARTLRAGEVLRFGSAEGEFRTVRLKQDAIAFQFHGWATGMASGSLDNPVPLMPARLEWLAERKALYLFWGAVLYLFGIATAVARWLRLEW